MELMGFKGQPLGGVTTDGCGEGCWCYCECNCGEDKCGEAHNSCGDDNTMSNGISIADEPTV